jgi:alpha-glucuronidase
VGSLSKWAGSCGRARLLLLACACTGAVSGLPAAQRPSPREVPDLAWLRYGRVAEGAPASSALPEQILVLGTDPVMVTAGEELATGLERLFGRRPRVVGQGARGRRITLAALEALPAASPAIVPPRALRPDDFWIADHDEGSLLIAGGTPRGVLYGAFALLRQLAVDPASGATAEPQGPAADIRWVNHWDNLDGTVERGYAGGSIFFANGAVVDDLSRVRAYARLLASVGINGCTINNVNADVRVLMPAFLPQLARVAAVFRPYGIRLSISVDFSSPRRTGGLDTFDPLDARVAAWWRARTDGIYAAVPDLGGFVLKADSEGRLGPSAYGRTHADAANVIARALGPHGGVLLYRGFVYDHHMDWRNPRNDRARAAFDNFTALDGQFDDNVVLQVKHGPIDFQVREPASPLFAALRKTNQVIELQITQEYTGQQRHVVFLAPMWQEVLDFDMHAGRSGTPVAQLVTGRTFGRPLGGFVGVSNVGLAPTWLGHDLALANLYAFGRLAWDPRLRAEGIAGEWSRLTFGGDAAVAPVVRGILMDSWPAYEGYTGPLGAGTLTDIINIHYGPGVESSERNGWGQWHRADEKGVGMDRTVATGTGYIGQYSAPVASMYESRESCPDALLLFMHHVPYTHVLHSGKTVIQHIYDSHYAGAADAAGFVERWRSLEGRVDAARYRDVLAHLEYQAGHAMVWRDAVCGWFRRMSGIPDTAGRVERVPGRLEAEAAQLTGYAPLDVTPWETASQGKAVACGTAGRGCSAAWRHAGAAGRFDLYVLYYDERDGASRFQLFVAGRPSAAWAADDSLPTTVPDGHSAIRRRFRALQLAPGSEIRIDAVPDAGERAVLDYIELVPVDPGGSGEALEER